MRAGEKQQIELFVTAANQEFAQELMADIKKLADEIIGEL
jgi:hypothetical protein